MPLQPVFAVHRFPYSSWLLLATSVLLVLLQLPSIAASRALKPCSTPGHLARNINAHGKPSNISVGFDLSPSYGVVSIVSNKQYRNGSYGYHGVFHARVEGNDEYKRVMKKLADPKMQHFAPPYNSMDESFRDVPRQYMRKARKAVGLPASPEVAALASMLSSLKAKATGWKQQQREGVASTTVRDDDNDGRGLSSSPGLEKSPSDQSLPRPSLQQQQQQHPITAMDPPEIEGYDQEEEILASATITLPHLVALYHEDIGDATSYAGIQEIVDPRPQAYSNKAGLVYHSSALQALANSTIAQVAGAEEPPVTNVDVRFDETCTFFAVGRYSNALTVSMPIVTPNFAVWEPEYRASVNFELGADREEEGEKYWRKVRDGLTPAEPRMLWMHGRPTLRVYGDEGWNSTKLRGAIEDVFRKAKGEHGKEKSKELGRSEEEEDGEHEKTSIEGKNQDVAGFMRGISLDAGQDVSSSTDRSEGHGKVNVPIEGVAEGAAVLAWLYKHAL
ncbi:MAG: hypothetical protein M1831_001975 [Alyxoria varia]|nr:MAG: hypothetical protein M1831_001975 [Alyxoria varia]